MHIQNIKIYLVLLNSPVWFYPYNGCLGASSICVFLFSLKLIIYALQLYILYVASLLLNCIMCCILTNTLVRP